MIATRSNSRQEWGARTEPRETVQVRPSVPHGEAVTWLSMSMMELNGKEDIQRISDGGQWVTYCNNKETETTPMSIEHREWQSPYPEVTGIFLHILERTRERWVSAWSSHSGDAGQLRHLI